MDNIDLLRKYADLYDKGNYLSIEESKVYSSVKNDPELTDIVKVIDSLPTKEEKYAAIAKYEASLQLQKKDELEKIKESCEKTFGIKLNNIEFKKLSNGKDIIAFYDPRLNRKRLIDYSYAKSLVTEFTNVQNNNELYQTEDYEQNAVNIAKAEATNNREFGMVDIEQFKLHYDELINMIPSNEQYKVEMINKLLNQSTNRNLKYINLENMVALDKDGNIVEAYKTSSLNGEDVQVGETVSYEGNVSSIDNVGNVQYNNGNSYTSTNQDIKSNNITPNEFDTEEEIDFPDDAYTDNQDFKEIVQEEMEKHQIQGLVDDEYNKVIDYSNNLNKLENDYENEIINENQYEFYKDLTEAYTKSKSLDRIKTRTLEYKQTGSVIIFILSFIAIIISIITIILIKL